MNKKLISLMATGMLCVSLAACGGGEKAPETPAPTEATTTVATQAPAAAEPLKSAPKAGLVGTYNLTPEWLAFEKPVVLETRNKGYFMPIADGYVHLNKDKATTYKLENGQLKAVKEKAYDTSYETITAGSDGMLYLSPGTQPFIGVKDLEPALQTTVKYYLVMHPTQDWGLTYWVGSDTQKVTIKDGIAKAEPWILTGMNDSAKRKGPFKSISTIDISENYIMVAGKNAENSAEKIVVYDLNGKEQFTLGGNKTGDVDLLGSIKAVAVTKNGFVAADGNMKRLFFWNTKGEFIGGIKIDELFGVSGWLQSVDVQKDGSLLVGVGAEGKNDVDELLVFKVTGF